MPATDSDLTSMEGPPAVEDEKGGLTDLPPSATPAAIIVSPPFPTTMTNFTGETEMENRAVSMASHNCSSALSSPAEASPAKPAVTSPNTCEGTVEMSPPTSNIASASDSLKCTGTNLVNITDSLPVLSEFPSTTFGSAEQKNDFSPVLTFKGITVSLENNSVWKQFNSCGTEMILTKQGRRMFPYCRYRLAGLDPERHYILVLSLLPSDQFKYRWNRSHWEITGPAENQNQGLIRAFAHHYSTCKGSQWMGGLVSFYKLKLTNNFQDHDGHIILHSMHRYIPRLHVIPVPDGVVTTPDQPVVMGPESMTFTFPQTEFMAVTTYQNFRITQLKINHNPFAKGFREDGHNPRLIRVKAEAQSVVKIEAQVNMLEPNESKEGIVDLSTKNHVAPASVSNVQESRLVLKPIMSTSNKNKQYVRCLRGKHALGDLVLVEECPLVESTEENLHNSVTPKLQHSFKAISTTPTPSKTSVGSSPRTRKKRKKMNRRLANRGREWKSAAATPPKVVHSPSLTVALQPELDDVEGLLFVSFTSKEALEVHVRNKPPNSTAPVSPVPQMSQKQLKQTEELIAATDEEKIVQKEALLLQDLRVFKHRQVIHPVLQEVGLKLSSLTPTKSVDLQYVGVHLPLPPANLPEQVNSTALSLGEKSLPFISRTGKTSDITKIKGWKNKFTKNKESSFNADGLQKNLSAFCSDLLDEYLESEAQQISERAAAFSTNSEGSVAYQLPAKGSSYVKTLDSVLKHRNPASNRPCPLSHKPLLYSAMTSQAPPLPSPATPVQAKSPSTLTEDANAVSGSSAFSHRSSAHHPASFGQNQGTTHRPAGLTKFELKLSQIEAEALNKGLRRTHLTPDRLTVALSVLLTKQMHIPGLKVSSPQFKDAGIECGKEFCRLGCVCSSLQHLNSGPLHCRRPECMFGCACFKRKITKHISAGEREPDIQPVYSMTNMQHVAQPRPGSHTNKLWKRNICDVDAEPLFVPESPQYLVSAKNVKRSSVTRPQPIREEDKDPVYKYLESMMTCARVRGVNSKPPPKVTIEPKIPDASTAYTVMKQKTTTDNLQGNHPSSVKKTAEKPGQETTAGEKEAKNQIQIQSACQWKQDHKMVLEALCQRMNQKRLSKRFRIGPYLICPLTKISMQKPSGSTVTYRVHISKPSKASDNEEDECDDSDEEDGLSEELDMQVGVTPFLGGVLPAGKLKARTKPAGSQPCALIQVNGKSYNQARLLLGSMGSLHPANRLAAYVTGRLHAPADHFHKNSQKPESTLRNNSPSALHVKATDGVVPHSVTANRTTELKIPTQSPVPLHLNSWRKGSTTFQQHSQNSSWVNPVQTFISSELSSVPTKSSPVSLTVSPSLKNPSFLGQSGTYSFRICPPANKSTRGQNPPGVALPGGFTIIDLPQPGSNDAPQPSETVKDANMAAVKNKSPPQQDALFNFRQSGWDANWLSLDTLSKSTSLEPRSSSKLVCGEKMPPGDDTNSRWMESNTDFTSDCLNSEDSDYCGDGDEDEELLDIETIEEEGQEKAIAEMKEAALKTLQESRNSSLFQSSLEPNMVLNIQEQQDKKKRTNHTALERQRRSEQRILFDKLQSILCGDLAGTKPPRLHLLSLAVKEIQNMAAMSEFLEEKKTRLAQLQSDYLKKLSILSGKSEMLIKHKLSAICRKQKMREKTMKWSPFFSQLLQSRAALLQNRASQSQHMPLLHPDFIPHKTAAQTNAQPIMAMLDPNSTQSSVNPPKPLSTPLSHPQAASMPAKADLSAALSQGENQEQPGAPAQGSVPNSQSQVPTGQDIPPTTATPVTTTPDPQNPSTHPLPSISLPLIRSKTGRLILPSSMKPTCPGFFTLMLMEAKLKRGGNGVSTLANTPSDVTAIMPSVAVQDNQEEGTVAGLSKTLPAPSNPKPPGVRRRRGRPRKNRVAPQPFPVEDDTRQPVSEERQSEKKSLELTKKRAANRPAVASDAADSPVPVKRRRGRPLKQRQPGELWIPAAHMRRGSSKSNKGSPVHLSYLYKGRDTETAENTLLGEPNTSRPLTRGALGKDLPSAKRRSWIDIEKELELELESE